MVTFEKHVGGFIVEGDPASWTPALWGALLEHYGVRSVLDVGCGLGYSTRFFLQRQLDATGVDGSDHAAAHTLAAGHFAHHDFAKEPYLPARTYDLCWSCEFVEHVEECLAENFLRAFDRCRVVAMTHALPGQGGHHHVNEQLDEYWIRVMEARGFRYERRLSPLFRQTALLDAYRAGRRSNYFSRSGLIFVNGRLPEGDRT